MNIQQHIIPLSAPAGWKTRVAAFLLAGFSVLSALLFHADFADQNQMTHVS